MNIITTEYKKHLLSLEEKPLNKFIKQFEDLKDYSIREEFLNKVYNKDIFNILIKEEFLKLFYLDTQAKYILKEISFNKLDVLKTLVYCYNSNSREFDKLIEENKLNERLLNEGFIFNDILDLESLKKLDGLKVVCVMDFNKIGLMGSFNQTEEKEGKFIYSEYQKKLMLIPKRSRTKGFLIYKKFYYKELKK